MQSIKITRGERVLAEHTTDSCLSHYGQAVWTIIDPDPAPGAVVWEQGKRKMVLDVLGVRGGWLVVRQTMEHLVGIIWSDGNYYADLIVDKYNRAVTRLSKRGGQHVRGAVVLGETGPDNLGSIMR